MNQILSPIAATNRNVHKWVERLLIVLTALLILDVLWGVFTRFALQSQSGWTEELARFLLIWVSCLGMASVFRHSEHLGIDVLVNAMDPSTQKIATLFYHVCTFAFAGFVLIYGGARVTANSLIAEQSMIALPFLKYWQYLILPVAGVIIASYAFESLLKALNEEAV